ncbi:tight junction protein ZO-3 isoform X3 [Hyla sarda]|uniref:tight junction protein ZO-3 isoform X3 n=2 Tax=Hyla sarda TaxID=327740 RepID=UPI0024C37A09|nr:tight junction protein ZO-3 isoform X3 [Hyla sarda]
MAVRFQVSEMEEMTIWEQYTVTLARDPRKGFGIAISGGRDRPSKTDGDNSVIVSDVVRGGPADGRLQTRDRIVMVNGVSMENVTSSFAIHTLKSCAKSANVTVKRPKKIQIPVSNSVLASTGPSRTPHTSGYLPDSYSRNEDQPDSPVQWRERYASSSRDPHEDTAQGYEGDSSSGRSSGGSRTPSSNHARHRRTRGGGSEAGNYSRRRTGKEKYSSGSDTRASSRMNDAGSGVEGSVSEAGDYSRRGSSSEAWGRDHNGLQLISGFKRLPIQDVPSKPVKTVLVKSTENQEYGLKLGSQIFIKHITETGLAAQEKSLQEGDLILKINGVASENMSLADTRRLIERSKGKLTLTVLRDNRQYLVNIPEVMDSESDDRSSIPDGISELSSDQSPPPSHPPPPPPGQTHRSSSESLENTVESHPINGAPSPQIVELEHENVNGEPPLDTVYMQETEPPLDINRDEPRLGYSPDARLVQFQKERSIGLRLAGGNDVGIFVAAVQEGSPAAREGMKEGDQILQVNETSFHNMTREDAIQYLMNLPQNEDVIILTQGKEDIYRKMIKSNVGDSFYIRTHFEYEPDTPSSLHFTRGEIFHVLDTMYRGKLGSWLAVRVARDLKEMDKGIIPNRVRAEQYASLENVLKPQSSSGPRAEFWKLRGLRGAKKILKKSREDLSAITSKAKYPPYEKVVLREASFKRPVVILGPITDIAHIKLCADLPQEYESAESVSRDDGSSKIIKLQIVKEIAELNKHALLDITPTAVEHLNYVQFYPIVVFCNPENRQGVKAMRQWLLPESKKSSRRLYAQAVKLRKNSSHLFTATINLSGASDSWLPSLKEIIRTEQARPIWTTEEKVEPLVTEPLDLMNGSAVGSTDYLSCDSRANSDYEETDAEGGAYTDQELDEEFQEPALARSSEPVVEHSPPYHDVNSPYDSYHYKGQSSIETSSYHGNQSPTEPSSPYRGQSPSHDRYSPEQEAAVQPHPQWNLTSREYEHNALRRKFNRARSSSSEDEDYSWGGPATDL